MLEKTRISVFFQWLVVREGRQVGSLKRRVQSHVVEEKGKIARRCGAKHIFKSKGTGMWKNGMLLCPEAHFQVKMLRIRTDGFRALFEDGMCKSGTALWREAHV